MNKLRADKSLLILTNHYPHRRSGGSFASLAYINAFSSIYGSTTLLYPARDSADLPVKTDSSINWLPVIDSRTNIRKGIDIYRGIIHRFRETGLSHIRNGKYDTVVFDSPIVSNNLIDAAIKENLLVITIHHNVEKDYYRDNPPGILYRFPLVNKVTKSQENAFIKSTLNITLSREDADRLLKLYGRRASGVTSACGVFEYNQLDTEVASNQEDEIRTDPVFGISGDLSFQQSDRSILRFLAEYWPGVTVCYPEARLIIAGRKPSRRLQRRCREMANVELVPNPEDIERVLSRCKYYISPLDTGSGVKMRNMDALRLGIPVLAHEVSARGYTSQQLSGIVYSYCSVKTFMEELTRMIDRNLPPSEIRRIYSLHYSQSAGINRLSALIKEHNV